jgi:diacylglycerol kinase family enzyme
LWRQINGTERNKKVTTTSEGSATARVDVVVNCNAGRLHDGSELRSVLASEARRGGAHLHETRSLDELGSVARQIAARGTQAVVLAGGDGAHMAGLTAFARAFDGVPPPTALVPGGTVCTIARNFGMRGSKRAWAQRLVRAACADDARVECRPTLRTHDDGENDCIGFIFGTGLVGRFFEAYYASGAHGLGGAARLAARVFAGSLVSSPLARTLLAPISCTVSVDGQPLGHRTWSLVLASTVRDVGLHIRATYRAGEEEGRFHVVASGLSPRALGMQVPRVLLGRPMRGDPCVDCLAHSLRVDFDGAEAYVLDGEMRWARYVHVEAGPVIKLLLPPQA